MLNTAPKWLLALIAPLLLAGCFMSPGKFASELRIEKSGAFSFSYKGEIFMAALSDLTKMGGASGATEEDVFTPYCYDDAGETRECTATEIAEQNAAWEEGRAEREEMQRAAADRRNEEMRAVLGGLDPSSPEAIDELIARLSKQKGWRSVVHKGNGLFEVDYAITGRMDHDFLFPTMERVPQFGAFLVATARSNGSIRVDAPAFSGVGYGGNSMAGLMQTQMMTGAAATGDQPKGVPQVDGTFAIITDGEILTNNTEDGPVTGADGFKRLEWRVTPRSDRAPEAVIKLIL